MDYEVLIVGGGAAGISVAAKLKSKARSLRIGLVDPNLTHSYQPGWTLVGGGALTMGQTLRPQRTFIPKGVDWIQDRCEAVDAKTHTVHLSSLRSVRYEQLILCPGLILDWSQIEGGESALYEEGVCSIYTQRTATKTWDLIRHFKSGEAIFTQPPPPIKCGGAPQKILYLAEDTFRKRNVRKDIRLRFLTAEARLFAVDAYERTLLKVMQRKEVDLRLQHKLVSIQAREKLATFECNGTRVQIPYDLLHVVPPMVAPDFIRKSSLSHAEGPLKGWLRVDTKTLQSLDDPDIFGLGDCAGLPTSKTAAAIRKQAPVVVAQVFKRRKGLPAKGPEYDGYTACPLTTGYGKLVLAEFNYEKKPTPSFPVDQTQELFSMWLLKRYALPWMYWNLFLPGRM